MQVNIMEAKSQLSQLVKAALTGEEVIIASHGQPQVKLIPCASGGRLKHAGGLAAA
jgi:prevent-host-death family protein